jgi:hypothetical protein
MADPQFSGEHRAQFKQLLAIGEVYALNFHPEHLPFGPWALGSDNLGDEDASERLQTRFQAAVRKAAIPAGAPARVGLLDWWICRLAGRKKRFRLEGLIHRSIERCEDLESKSAELRLASPALGIEAGLRRDRYEVDLHPRERVYDHPHDPLPDPKREFDYWYGHVWQGLCKLIGRWDRPRDGGDDWQSPDGLIYDLRGRLPGEARTAFRNRVAKNILDRYETIGLSFQSVAYDLAVLLANYIIDSGFRGCAATREFQDQSTDLVERVTAFWHESSKRLGLSNRKQERQMLAVAESFREVGADLRNLMFETPTVAEPAIRSSPSHQGPTPPRPLIARDIVEAGGGPPRNALRAIREDQERRAEAKRDLEQALQRYEGSLARESDRSLIELAGIWCAYAATLYDSLAKSHVGPPGDPSELFNESGELAGGLTVAQVKYDLQRIRLPRPKHWPAPQNFGDDVSLELHRTLQSIALSAPVSFTWLLDDPWFMSEILKCLYERVQHWKDQLGSFPHHAIGTPLDQTPKSTPAQLPAQDARPGAPPGGEAKEPKLRVTLIKDWMDDEGWTNKTLAQRLKISERAVSSIRNNGEYHGSEAVTKLANLMGKDPLELYEP